MIRGRDINTVLNYFKSALHVQIFTVYEPLTVYCIKENEFQALRQVLQRVLERLLGVLLE